MSDDLENRLRSWFLPILITYSVMASIIGVYVLVQELGNRPIWLAVTMANLQILLFFLRLYLVNVPRTSPGLFGFSVGIFLATMYSVYTSYQLQEASIAPLLAFVGLAGWVAYVGWYSDLGDRSSDRIRLGKKLPEIRLQDYDGKPVSPSDWNGQKRLVIFYRGNWCPICTAQINELTKFENQFLDQGVRITLISPQSHEKSRQYAQRVGMDFDFLVDVNNEAAKKLGILQPHGLPKGFEMLGYDTDVPKPTTFVLDENGKVIFADLTTNYRVRTRPEDILAAIET